MPATCGWTRRSQHHARAVSPARSGNRLIGLISAITFPLILSAEPAWAQQPLDICSSHHGGHLEIAPDRRLRTVRRLSTPLYRVTDAVLLGDGRIVVGNGGSGELLFHDQAGNVTSRAGGPGAGPNDVSRMGSLRRAFDSDSIDVIDAGFGLKIFSESGDFGRALRLQEGDGILIDALRFEDAMVVFQEGSVGRVVVGREYPRQATVWHVGDDALRHEIGQWPSGGQLHVSTGGTGFSSLAMPFASRFWLERLGSNCFVVPSRSSGGGIEVISELGVTLTEVGVPGLALAVTEADWNDWIEKTLEGSVHKNEWDFSEIRPPKERTAWSRVRVAEGGVLWLQPYNSDKSERARLARIDLLDGTIEWLTLPDPTSRLLAATREQVVVVVVDQLDVEWIHVLERR